MKRLALMGLLALTVACESSGALECDPEQGGTAAIFFPDVDGDGVGAGEGQLLCPENAARGGMSETDTDCAPEDQAAFRVWVGFVDTDEDGVSDSPGEICAGSARPLSLGHEIQDCSPGDGTRWHPHRYAALDADRDGYFVRSSGIYCGGGSLPPEYSAQVPFVEDCNDEDPAQSVALQAYRDADGDGFGGGLSRYFCTPSGDPPTGWALLPGDCDDQDPATFEALHYQYRDADLDGMTIYDGGWVCTDGALPPGYLRSGQGSDCDDNDPAVSQLQRAYLDEDHDGFGVGALADHCVGSELPEGLSRVNTDCDDHDPSSWATYTFSQRDADGDGYTVPQLDPLCAGAEAPSGYLNQASAEPDCDDADASVFATHIAYADADADGHGVEPAQTLCTDGPLPASYALEVGDCAPADPQYFLALNYAGVDRDGDGVPVEEAGTLCTEGALPTQYAATVGVPDCDDTNAAIFALTLLFDDLDGDGVGAGVGRKLCLNTTLPAGTSRYGDDPDDQDPQVLQDEELIDLLTLEL